MSIASQRGQTIIELLVALTLIILFLSGVIVIQLLSLRNVQFSQNKSEAAKLASAQLERARVIRDSVGVDGLLQCASTCFINAELTPIPVTPTGTFGQSLRVDIASSSECPLPTDTGGVDPVLYFAQSLVEWESTREHVDRERVQVNSCIADWR